MTRLLAACALAAVLSGGAAAQGAEPPPWTLEFKHSDLESYTLSYKDGSAETVYYMTFTVKNDSQREAKLALHIRADVQVGKREIKRKVHHAVPHKNAEEAIRRVGRAPQLKSVQQINDMKTLAPGQSVRGIAVFGTFNREWDTATIYVSGLESASLHARVRKYAGAGHVLFHRAYKLHNDRVKEKVQDLANYTEVNAIIQHDVVRVLRYRRKGDEFAPQVDPILSEGEWWDVRTTKIVYEKKPVFGQE